MSSRDGSVGPRRSARGRPAALAAIATGMAGAALYGSVVTWWRQAPEETWTLALVLIVIAVPLGIASAVDSAIRGRLIGLPLAAGLAAIVLAALVVTWIVLIYERIGPNF
jgi:uncharacterized membrane protein